jgi:hypothetical protein
MVVCNLAPIPCEAHVLGIFMQESSVREHRTGTFHQRRASTQRLIGNMNKTKDRLYAAWHAKLALTELE